MPGRGRCMPGLLRSCRGRGICPWDCVAGGTQGGTEDRPRAGGVKRLDAHVHVGGTKLDHRSQARRGHARVASSAAHQLCRQQLQQQLASAATTAALGEAGAGAAACAQPRLTPASAAAAAHLPTHDNWKLRSCEAIVSPLSTVRVTISFWAHTM